MTAIAARSY